jgi:hypothetical protein
MDIENIYLNLTRISELEKNLNASTKLDNKGLLEYHKLVGSIPILSPEEILELNDYYQENVQRESKEIGEEYKGEIRSRIDRFKERIRKTKKYQESKKQWGTPP